MIKVPEETLKQWRNEFKDQIESDQSLQYSDTTRFPNGKYIYSETGMAWNYFLAAKTSSYEREQSLIREVEVKLEKLLVAERGWANSETKIQKLQERIKELENQVMEQDALLGNPSVSVDATMHKLKSQLSKRDELIARAITMLKTIDRFNDVREWLEQVEDLKENK